MSIATVSRVVHGQDLVRPSTRERVLEVIDALGYVPDAAAQSLSRRRKEVIGLAAVESRSPESDVEEKTLLFVEEVLRGAEAALRDVGWSLLISFIRNDEDAYERLRALSGKVDGMLIAEGIVTGPQLARLATRLPVVVVAGSPHETRVDVVDADNRTGMHALVSHLVVEHGLGRFYFVAGPLEAPDAAERRNAFDEVLASHVGAEVVGTFPGQFSVVSGQLAAHDILGLTGRRRPEAVVCANDQMAIGVIKELAAGGVRVPDDIAVVGFDDMYASALLDPPLTTVNQPMRLLGQRATTRVLERIADPRLPRRVEMLPTELAVRTSCGCPGNRVIPRPSQNPRRRPVPAKVSA